MRRGSAVLAAHVARTWRARTRNCPPPNNLRIKVACFRRAVLGAYLGFAVPLHICRLLPTHPALLHAAQDLHSRRLQPAIRSLVSRLRIQGARPLLRKCRNLPSPQAAAVPALLLALRPAGRRIARAMLRLAAVAGTRPADGQKERRLMYTPLDDNRVFEALCRRAAPCMQLVYLRSGKWQRDDRSLPDRKRACNRPSAAAASVLEAAGRSSAFVS